LGEATNSLGDYARVREIFEEGIAPCREVGCIYRLPDFLNRPGYALRLEGDYERAAAVRFALDHGLA